MDGMEVKPEVEIKEEIKDGTVDGVIDDESVAVDAVVVAAIYAIVADNETFSSIVAIDETSISESTIVLLPAPNCLLVIQ